MKTLAKGCDFKAVSSERYNSGMIRDALMSNAFINGLMSNVSSIKSVESSTVVALNHSWAGFVETIDTLKENAQNERLFVRNVKRLSI